MPSFSKAATYLMYSSVMDDEDATFKSRLSPEDRRRRDRRIPRRANLSYYEDSPFKNIFDSGDDQALLNLTGLDHHTFSKLLGIYQPHYSCFTWCRIFKSVRRLKICSRRRRMLDATSPTKISFSCHAVSIYDRVLLGLPLVSFTRSIKGGLKFFK